MTIRGNASVVNNAMMINAEYISWPISELLNAIIAMAMSTAPRLFAAQPIR